jgi:hypothetical protein
MEQRHLLHAAKKQRKTDRKEPEQDIPFEDTPPDFFPPSRSHLLIAH